MSLKNKTGLLIVAVLLGVIAVGIELFRHVVAAKSADSAELLLGIEIFVWIFLPAWRSFRRSRVT